MEKGINFKIDAELYKKIKIKVAKEDISIKEYLKKLIVKDLESKNLKNG